MFNSARRTVSFALLLTLSVDPARSGLLVLVSENRTVVDHPSRSPVFQEQAIVAPLVHILHDLLPGLPSVPVRRWAMAADGLWDVSSPAQGVWEVEGLDRRPQAPLRSQIDHDAASSSDGPFYPLPPTVVSFHGDKFDFPEPWKSVLRYRWWQQEGPRRQYGLPGKGQSRAEATHLELSSVRFPEVRLLLQIEGVRKLRVTYYRTDSPRREELVLSLGEPETNRLSISSTRVAQLFMDDAVGIPLEPGPERAAALKEWLLALDREGKALVRETSSIGLGTGVLSIPAEIRDGFVPVRILSEGGPKSSRYLLFVDTLNPGHWLMLETGQGRQPAAAPLDTLTGEAIPGFDSSDTYRYYYLHTFKRGRDFLQHATRRLVVTSPGEGGGLLCAIRSDQTRNRDAIGLPTGTTYKILKTRPGTSASITNFSNFSKQNRPALSVPSSEPISFPLMIGDADLDAPEALPEGLDLLVPGDRPDLLWLPGDVPDAFLGYSLRGDYAYWKQVGLVTHPLKGVHTVYRRVQANDEHLWLSAQTETDDAFSIEGVRWAVGARAGEPVLFRGRLALGSLAAKYGDGSVLSIPESLLAKIRQTAGDIPLRPGIATEPQLFLDQGVPYIAAGERFSIKAKDPDAARQRLHHHALVEKKLLTQDLPPRSLSSKAVGGWESGWPAGLVAVVRGAIQEAGVLSEQQKHHVLRILSAGIEDEVVDTRPGLTWLDRVQWLRSRRSLLSAKGQAYLDSVEAAIHSGSPEALATVAEEFPTVARPHLDYFIPSNSLPEVLSTFPDPVTNLKITQGCSRGCLHCFFNPSPQVRAMPFNRILEFVTAAKQVPGRELLGPRGLTLYYDTEMFDYYDPIYDADVGDVIGAILDAFPTLTIHITTRGWYRGNQIAPRAMAKIQTLMKAKPQCFSSRISLDLFDIKGDVARYIVRAVELLDHFRWAHLRLSEAGHPGNRQQTLHMREIVLALTTHDNIFDKGANPVSRLSHAGRGARLGGPDQAKPTHDVGECMFGINLWPDGRVRQKRYIEKEGTFLLHEFVDLGIALWGPDEPIDVLAPKHRAKSSNAAVRVITPARATLTAA